MTSRAAPKKALVTGAAGFIGGFLIEHLAANGHEVHAMDLVPASALSEVRAPFSYHSINLLQREAVSGLLRDLRPDTIFHLAAQSFPGVSWDRPVETFDVNVGGSLNIFESTVKLGLKTRVVVFCSSAEYAQELGAEPIPEDARLNPSTPYGISKLTQDHAARLYCERYGLPVLRVRPFFLIGPRKKGDVSSDFARGIVAIERGEQSDLSVGVLEIVRDLLDIRDGVDAIRLVSEQGKPGDVYNICSGRGVSLREVLNLLKSHSKVAIREQLDPAKVRPIEEPIRIGDPSKIKALGWMPTHSIEKTLEEILDYWRNR